MYLYSTTQPMIYHNSFSTMPLEAASAVNVFGSVKTKTPMRAVHYTADQKAYALNNEDAACAPLLGVIAGLDQPHIGGNGDNILVSFTGPAPAGWVLQLSSGNDLIELPASYAVPQGAYNIFVPFVSEPVAEPVDISVSVSLAGHTVSAALRVCPGRYRQAAM